MQKRLMKVRLISSDGAFSLIPLDIFQMVAEASTQPLVEQQEQQVSAQEVQELKDTLGQAEVKTKALEAQVESLQKVRTEQT